MIQMNFSKGICLGIFMSIFAFSNVSAQYNIPTANVKIAGLIDLGDLDEDDQNVPYNELPCTAADKERIADIVVTLGKYAGAAEIALLAHSSRLNSHEKELRHVHPLKFIETVMLDDELRGWLPSVMGGFFTRRGFFGDENSNGLAQRLTLNAKLGKVDCYRQDFANSLKLNAENIRPYFDAHDWEGMMNYLLEVLQ